HRSDPLPDESPARQKSKFGWIAPGVGSWGTAGKGKDSPDRGSEILLALCSLLQRADDRALGNLYHLVMEEPLLSSLEFLMRELTEALRSLDRGRLLEVARYFAIRAAHREAVKFGLALIGIVGKGDDLDTLRVLGRNEEFTLYVAAAIEHVAPDRE